MDTISQENNESFSWLPVLALVVGVVAAVLGIVALKKTADLNKALADQAQLSARIDSLEAEVRKSATAADQAGKSINKVIADTQKGFNTMGDLFRDLTAQVEEIKANAAKPAPVAAAPASSSSNGGAAPVAGPGEYLVKSGDNGYKIARTLGVSWSDLQAVNPSVNWNHLNIGQKIKVPKK